MNKNTLNQVVYKSFNPWHYLILLKLIYTFLLLFSYYL